MSISFQASFNISQQSTGHKYVNWKSQFVCVCVCVVMVSKRDNKESYCVKTRNWRSFCTSGGLGQDYFGGGVTFAHCSFLKINKKEKIKNDK